MENRIFGAIPSPKDVRNYRVACASNITFPDTFELKMPEVKDQGSVGSCVAHAISTVVEYFNRTQEDDYTEMSVGYIYGNRLNTTHTGYGMITSHAIKSVCEYGDIPKNLFPYNEEVPEIIEKFKAVKDEFYSRGTPNRFSTYFCCKQEAEIKTALMKNTPVIMVMEWYSDIRIINGIVFTEAKSKSSNGFHCMVIYGWNETGWKIQNSWGTNWGREGRAILPYNVPISELWGITDNISQKNKIKELENSNDELNIKINELSNTIEIYINDIENLSTDNELLREKINEELEDNELLKETLEDNESLKEELEETSKDNESLTKQLEEKLNNINLLEGKIEEGLKELSSLQELVEKQKIEIENLTNENIELKKPYSSKFGKVMASIINFIANLFTNGLHK